MILILGSPTDILLREVNRRLSAAGLLTHFVSEKVLFEATPFAFERDGQETHGFLRINGDEISMTDLTGVLVRIPHTWWPSSEFILQDQMFVYHETIAAWLCLLSNLACPVINRFALCWWLQDWTYTELLRNQLSWQLELDTIPHQPATFFDGHLLPTPSVAAPNSASVYVVGMHLIPRSVQCRNIVERLAPKAPLIASWQDDSGIKICRLDFEHDQGIRLKHVEVFPLLDEERSDLVAQVSAATVRLLL